eukprot:39485-Eustigmatos_ZCMA.PRE.1
MRFRAPHTKHTHTHDHTITHTHLARQAVHVRLPALLGHLVEHRRLVLRRQQHEELVHVIWLDLERPNVVDEGLFAV